MNCLSNCCNRTTGIRIFGITITTLGITLFFLKVWIMELISTSILVLKPNSIIDNVWRKIPDIHADIYFFDWINPEDFHNFSIKPKFEEIGPYTFKQTIEKMDVVWNMNNTVTYSQYRHLYFDEDITNGNLSKEFNTCNVASLFVSHYLRNENYFLKKLVSAYLTTSGQGVNMTLTPQKLFFDGIDNFLVDVGSYFPFIYPELPRFDKLSIMSMVKDYTRYEGIFNMGTNGSFEIRNWNFYNIVPHLNASCAKVHGSLGELNPRNLSKQYLGIFAGFLCRYGILDFQKEVTVHGIVGYKYVVSTGLLDNGTLIPGNECYCNGDCLPSGMLNMSSCHYGFPIFASLPHFYGADPVYVDAVEGLHPKKEKHETYIVIEPITGILLKTSGKIQINFRIKSVEDISMYENSREMMFPMAWLHQRSTLPDNIILLLHIYFIFPSVLSGIASILILLGLTLLCFSYKTMLISWYKKLFQQKQRILSTQEEIPLRACENNVKTVNT